MRLVGKNRKEAERTIENSWVPQKFEVRCELSDEDSGLSEDADHGSHKVLVLVITEYLKHIWNEVSGGGIRVKKSGGACKATALFSLIENN